MGVQELRQRLEREKGRHGQVVADLAQALARLDNLKELALRLERVQLILQEVAQITQSQLAWYVDDMTSAAIEAVFPEHDYKLRLEFVQRRGTTEADIVLSDGQGHRVRPRDADGGGLINVAAFALRVALWSLSKSTRPVLVLDEPLHFLHSKDAHARAAELLQEISSRLGLQIIMVTGEETEEIISTANRVFEIKEGKIVNVIDGDL